MRRERSDAPGVGFVWLVAARRALGTLAFIRLCSSGHGLPRSATLQAESQDDVGRALMFARSINGVGRTSGGPMGPVFI